VATAIVQQAVPFIIGVEDIRSGGCAGCRSCRRATAAAAAIVIIRKKRPVMRIIREKGPSPFGVFQVHIFNVAKNALSPRIKRVEFNGKVFCLTNRSKDSASCENEVQVVVI
jgi:hypothetical protein